MLPDTAADLRALYRAAEARAARLRVLVEASQSLSASPPDGIAAAAAEVALKAAHLAGFAHGRIVAEASPVLPGSLAVPLSAPGGAAAAVGTLLLEQPLGVLAPEDREALGIIAQLIGSALAAQAREQRLALLLAELLGTQEVERSRVAHELHDGVAQSAAALARRLDLAADGDPADLAEATRQARALVRELRQVIAGMRPPVLDDLGLVPALRHLAGEAGEGLSVTMSLELAGRPGRDIETALFRVVQEALSNARAHAGAGAAVHIGLAETDEGYRLAITDNGAGFDPRNQPAARAGSGLGLAYMRERIERLGGQLTIASAPGQGTQLVAELPA